MLVKISSLTNIALDWAVAKCLGYKKIPTEVFWSPSTNWEFGGPIIERERIELGSYADLWQATMHLEYGSIFERDRSPLIAAMRCYVVSVVGEEIDIPKNLLDNLIK